jgi:DNA-binding response OmpR family regulator
MRLEKRILIVDDDDAIRALITTVLRKRGYVVDAARNGADALENLVSCRYSLMILDLMMPVTNGYEVLSQLADMSVTSRPLVLVLTAGLESRKFDSTFVVGTMAKPFDIDLLVSTVVGCLQVCEAREQLEHCPDALPKDDKRTEDVN